MSHPTKRGGKPNIVICGNRNEHHSTELRTYRHKQDKQGGPHQKSGGELRCSRRVNSSSYKIPVVLLIYTVKIDKRLDSDRGKETST